YVLFPLLKYRIRQLENGTALNRQQRRHLKKLKSKHGGFWIIAIDRTQWKERNVFMASLIWGTHALPLYFEEIGHKGNSDLVCQKRLIQQVLRLFKSKKFPILILGDREFHSPKLAEWLEARDISFCLRQRKSFHFKVQNASEYEIVGKKGFKPGQSEFYSQVLCGKEDGIGPMNLAVYWKRKYRGKGPTNTING
ncbi:MAG: transposase, partial [Pseudomonadota bacterium]